MESLRIPNRYYHHQHPFWLAHFENYSQDVVLDRASFLPHFTAFHRRNFCFFADGASVERRALVRVVFRSVVKFVMICATGRAPTHRYLSSIRSWKVQFTDKLGGAMIYVWKLDKLIFPAWVSNICIKPWIGLQMFINCVCHNSVKSGSGGPGGRLLACQPERNTTGMRTDGVHGCVKVPPSRMDWHLHMPQPGIFHFPLPLQDSNQRQKSNDML